MRDGPHPLYFYIGAAPYTGESVRKGEFKNIKSYSQHFSIELNFDDMLRVVKGIKKYQGHPYKARQPAPDTIWESGTVSVKKYFDGGLGDFQNNNNDAILLVPSLVNRSDILDLCENRSLARWLVQRGYKTYLLDWGGTSDHRQDFDIDDAVQKYIVEAVTKVCGDAASGVSVIGYCMGGTLSLAAAALNPDLINRLVVMAAPWDFHSHNIVLSQRVREWAPFVLPIIEERGYLPAAWTQALFASIDPVNAAEKFIRFSKLPEDSVESKLFVAVEDWLNDGVDLSGKIAIHCIKEWFSKNALVRNEWRVNSNFVRLENIDCPVLVVASTGDYLVPYDSANCVCGLIKNADVKSIKLGCGHVSMIAGKRAVEDVWQPIATWLKTS